jgi:hypothetical protein
MATTRTTKKRETKIVDNPPARRKVRLMDEDSPISNEPVVETKFPSQVPATGTQELEYELEENRQLQNEVSDLHEDEAPTTEKGRLLEMVYKTNKPHTDSMRHEHVELRSSVGDGEDPEEVYKYLKGMAEYLLDVE